MIALGTAILVASTAYGCVAIRLFLGPAAARRTLASPWPWHFWVGPGSAPLPR